MTTTDNNLQISSDNFSHSKKETNKSDCNHEINDSNKAKVSRTCCNKCADTECHKHLFFDWIIYKYKDDPCLKYVSKDRWRYVLYSEYFMLSNFRKYRYLLDTGQINWPWNIYNQEAMPTCLGDALERYINVKYYKEGKEWHAIHGNLLLHIPDIQEKWRDMSDYEIEISYSKQVARDRKRNKNPPPEMDEHIPSVSEYTPRPYFRYE